MVIVMVTLWAILAVQLIHPINYRTLVVVRVQPPLLFCLFCAPVWYDFPPLRRAGFGLTEIASDVLMRLRASGKVHLESNSLSSALPADHGWRLLNRQGLDSTADGHRRPPEHGFLCPVATTAEVQQTEHQKQSTLPSANLRFSHHVL